MNALEALRDLDTPQQVGLLFLALFGALSLATVAALVLSLPEHTARQRERQLRLRRDLRALWTGATVFWLAWMSGPAGATTLFAILSFLALREYITLMHTRRGDHRGLLLAFFVILPLQYVLVGRRHFDLFTVFIPVYAFIAIPVVGALAGDAERFLERNAKIQWGMMVCVYGLSHAPALLLLDLPGAQGRGAFMVLFLVAVVAAAQIAQEAASRLLRRRPVARQLRRSFSHGAWLVGALAATALGGLLFWVTPFAPAQALALGLIAAVSGTLGDLVMKALKRDAGVRHWGNAPSVTGAVGLLDRIAPLCFAAPVFFHSLRWYLQVAP